MIRLLLCLTLLLPTLPSWAEDFPTHPLKIIVPTGAGGITDVLARLVADKLGKAGGQPVVVENRPGASGIIGSDYVARAAPDGYTLLFVYPSHPVNPSLFTKLPYDTATAFVPIVRITTFPAVLLVKDDFPAHTLAELIALAKSKSEPLAYGSVGNGSLAFLAAELFAQKAGIKLEQVPYKGAPQTMMGLLSGDISIYFDVPLTALPQMKSGKVRALAVTSAARLAAMPDVPAAAETLPGFEALGWNAILAPKGTPDAIVAKLNQLTVGVLKTPEVQNELAEQGLTIVADSPAEFGAALKADLVKWAEVLKNAGIKPE